MAKQRFNLNETMLDARQGIEEARANAEKAGEESAATQEKEGTEAEYDRNTSSQSDNAPDEIALQKNGSAPEHEELEPKEDSIALKMETPCDKPEKIESSSVEKKINGIRKKIRKDEKEGRIMRNVYLEEDMLEKLEDIKKSMNKGRNKEKKDTLVFVIDLLNVAAQEFIDKYYKDIVGK